MVFKLERLKMNNIFAVGLITGAIIAIVGVLSFDFFWDSKHSWAIIALGFAIMSLSATIKFIQII